MHYVNYPSPINKSRYFTQIIPYIEKFGKENVLTLDFDNIANNINSIKKQTAEFLNIDGHKYIQSEKIHANKSIGEYKMNYKLEQIVKFFGKPFPIQFKTKVASFIIKNKKSKLKERPILNKKDFLMLNYIFRIEIESLELVKQKDLSK